MPSVDSIFDVRPCLFAYLGDIKKEDQKSSSEFRLLANTIEFEYVYGLRMGLWTSHEDTVWRILPYTTIVYVGECDPNYSIEVMDTCKIKIGRNTAVVVPSGTPIKFKLDGNAYLSNAHIMFTFLDHIDVFSLYSIPLILSGEVARDIGFYIDNLYEYNVKYSRSQTLNVSDLIHMKSFAYRLLDTIIMQSEYKAASQTLLEGLSRISSVLDYVKRNRTAPITRKSMADICGLSETRFHYIFKDTMGIAPMEYLRGMRMMSAQHLLITTEEPISNIATLVGIPDVSHFSKLFKGKYHVSPLIYRNIHKANAVMPELL